MTGGAPGRILRDRPFIDDEPARKYGWEALSRWGSRPFREFGRSLARGAKRVTSLRKRLRSKGSGAALLVMEALLVGAGLAGQESCSEARAVVAAPHLIDQVHLGFGLDREGRVSPGCTASTFSLGDPIHLSVQVSDAAAGSVLTVSVRDVVTQRIAWSEARPVTAGRSSTTFAIGRTLALGRYRAESSFDGIATMPREFVVHDRRPGVR